MRSAIAAFNPPDNTISHLPHFGGDGDGITGLLGAGFFLFFLLAASACSLQWQCAMYSVYSAQCNI
jgi:hypothetical protein